jgi:hypothetical protein
LRSVFDRVNSEDGGCPAVEHDPIVDALGAKKVFPALLTHSNPPVISVKKNRKRPT